jgi:hypothetical protein
MLISHATNPQTPPTTRVAFRYAFAGFELGRRYHAPTLYWIVLIPMWATTLLLAAYPAFALARAAVLRPWRRRRNLCMYCGYNLTGLTRPRCPECGKAIS